MRQIKWLACMPSRMEVLGSSQPLQAHMYTNHGADRTVKKSKVFSLKNCRRLDVRSFNQKKWRIQRFNGEEWPGVLCQSSPDTRKPRERSGDTMEMEGKKHITSQVQCVVHATLAGEAVALFVRVSRLGIATA